MNIEFRIATTWDAFSLMARKDSLKEDYGYLLQLEKSGISRNLRIHKWSTNCIYYNSVETFLLLAVISDESQFVYLLFLIFKIEMAL